LEPGFVLGTPLAKVLLLPLLDLPLVSRSVLDLTLVAGLPLTLSIALLCPERLFGRALLHVPSYSCTP
jgi:hypothetical protein